MRTPLWAYGGGFLALAGAMALAGMNVTAALGGDPAPWPTTLRVLGAVAADIAAACLPFAFIKAHRMGWIGTTAFLVVLWLGSCAYTVNAAMEWNISQSTAISRPLERARWIEATAKGTYAEQLKVAIENVRAANALVVKARYRAARTYAADVLKDAKAELKRLQDNPPRQPAELRETHVKQAFSELPWFWPAFLLVFSQAGWLVLSLARNEVRQGAAQSAASEVAPRAAHDTLPHPNPPRGMECGTECGKVRHSLKNNDNFTAAPMRHGAAQNAAHECGTNVVPIRKPPSKLDAESALRQCGSRRAAAQYLGISPRTLGRLLENTEAKVAVKQ
jgi:hypothetical protein